MYIYSPKSFLKMQPHILPVTIPSSPASSSSIIAMPLTSSAADTLLLRSEDDSVSISSPDGKKTESKPFLPRSSSYDGSSTTSSVAGAGARSSFKFDWKRRRRIASDGSLSKIDDDGKQQSFGQNVVGRAATNTFMMTRFSFEMLRYLGVGYKWITRFLALGCYAVLLFPGFVQIAYYYYFSSQVRRDIVYGDQPRNKLDLYLPRNTDGPKPVIAIITGGAWIIGYKAWGSLLGKHLSERDIIVACIDYRNFPQVMIGDMVKDASQGISFVCNHISEYGGDPNRIFLMGQSAGAHIAACALVEQAIKGSGEGESTSWSVSQINAYFGLSGGYNLPNLVDHFNSRGLYKSLFFSIMEGEASLRRYSPDIVVQDPHNRNAISLLPPIILYHGTADYSIPSDESKTFVDTLQRLGLKAESVLYEGRTHTDLFLQDPMRGDDEMFEDIVTYVHAGDPQALAKHAAAPRRKRLVPELMLKLARKVSPF